MATILELGYREEGEMFQPLPLEVCTPIYFDDWTFSSEPDMLYNEEPIKFDVDLKGEKEINCVGVNLLPGVKSDVRECFIDCDKTQILQPISDQVTFHSGQAQIGFG
jgi:hypothetical protein